MSDRLDALRLFIRVARRGSFSAAGRELGMPQSTVSRTIATLEREIGASLLVRTTGAVTVTDAGADLLARIEPIVADLQEAEQTARHSDELRGVLRVGIGTSLAARIVIPHLKPFLDRHPALRVDLLLDDEKQDLVKEGVDVAFRFGALADSAATARKLVTWPRALAAPELPSDGSTPERADRLSRSRDHCGSAGRRGLDIPQRGNDRVCPP